MKNYVFLNRPPTLWRHSMPLVEVLPSDDDSIHMNPLILEPFNADFDGDALMVYYPHDVISMEEAYQEAFYGNDVFYDQNGRFMSVLRHEALYGAYVLTDDTNVTDNVISEYSHLEQLPIRYDWLNDRIYDLVNVDSVTTTYGRAVFNKLCGFSSIVIDFTVTKKTVQKVSEEIYKDSSDNLEYYQRLNFLMQNLMVFITITKHCPSIDINTIVSLVDDTTRERFSKLPKENPYLGYFINQGLIDRILKYKIDKNSELYRLYICGARFNKTQLARFAINIGYFADADNYVYPEPICSSLTEGTTEKEFFNSCFGSRKAIKDKSANTPRSGALERTMVMSLSVLEVVEGDCGTNDTLRIKVMSKEHAESLIGKYATIVDHRLLEKLGWRDTCDNIITRENCYELVGKEIKIRSPLVCKTKNNRVCRKCTGHVARDKKYVGIIAGQCFMENFTQLVLRTFHTSGAAEITLDGVDNDKILELFRDYYVDHNENNAEYIVHFDGNGSNLDLLEKIPGFLRREENTFYFSKIADPVKNKDIISTLDTVNRLIKPEKNPQHPLLYYYKLMEILLSVGQIYSTFIELLLCNMFITEDGNYWRYSPESTPVFKIGVRSLAKKLSPVLGFLHQPNLKTIDFDEVDTISTIYERLFLGDF